MPAAFPRTLAALRGERQRAPLIALALAIVILSAWLAWGLEARISVYRSSEHARLEVVPGPARVAAPVEGRVTAVHLQVGATVAAGDVLVDLDATAEQIAAARAHTRIAALEPQLASSERELAAEDAGGRSGAEAELDAEREVDARRRAADAGLALAERDLAREQQLADKGASPREALDRATALVAQRRATFEAVQHEADSLGASHRERDEGRRAHREQLEREHDEIASDLAATRAEAARLDHEVERRTIRAPVAGTLGEVAALRPGAVVHDGDVVASVVPAGQLQVVAEYGAAALGRLAPGQHARLRVDGFPWTRYGTVPATVTRVGSELRDGTIRVELALAGDSPAIPVRHGMTGVVDVEVERASPVALLLRTIGESLDRAEAR
ncbi:MAG: HlyD family secretion protein [Acidobacteriota bacterium]